MIIKYDWLPVGMNRGGEYLNPIGIIIHETATLGATDEAESSYFHNGDHQSSAHVFVDYDSATWLIPENEVAWHALDYANHHFLAIEICHFDDPTKFAQTWANAVEIVRSLCDKHGWGPSNIHSHQWVSENYAGDHTDPVGYFSAHGLTLTDFINNVFSSPIEEEEVEEMYMPTPKVINNSTIELPEVNYKNPKRTPDGVWAIVRPLPEAKFPLEVGLWALSAYTGFSLVKVFTLKNGWDKISHKFSIGTIGTYRITGENIYADLVY